jgi:hypothetical protein
MYSFARLAFNDANVTGVHNLIDQVALASLNALLAFTAKKHFFRGTESVDWAHLTHKDQVQVLTNLASQYRLYLNNLGPAGSNFTSNFKSQLVNIAQKPWMTDEPDMIRMASAPANIAAWEKIPKPSAGEIAKHRAWVIMTDAAQTAEYEQNEGTLAMCLLQHNKHTEFN